jgi:DNA-binding GntR family transcriptional regulator
MDVHRVQDPTGPNGNSGSDSKTERRGRRAPIMPVRAGVGRVTGSKTASAMIHSALRMDIIRLVRRPGEPISEKELAHQFGVSRTPVREALLRLAEERLVEIFPQSGTFVARIPLADLPEAILVRRSLEVTMADLAAQRRRPEGLTAMAKAIERQKLAAEQQDMDAFHQGDDDFHAAIALAADHPAVWTLVQSVKTQVDRYRRLTLPVPGRMLAVIRDHEPIDAAIRKGQAAEAMRLMVEHLSTLMRFAEIGLIDSDNFLGNLADVQPAEPQPPS